MGSFLYDGDLRHGELSNWPFTIDLNENICTKQFAIDFKKNVHLQFEVKTAVP